MMDAWAYGRITEAAVMANFKNRGAATFFKDITTIGALLVFAVHGPGRLRWGKS